MSEIAQTNPPNLLKPNSNTIAAKIMRNRTLDVDQSLNGPTGATTTGGTTTVGTTATGTTLDPIVTTTVLNPVDGGSACVTGDPAGIVIVTKVVGGVTAGRAAEACKPADCWRPIARETQEVS